MLLRHCLEMTMTCYVPVWLLPLLLLKQPAQEDNIQNATIETSYAGRRDDPVPVQVPFWPRPLPYRHPHLRDLESVLVPCYWCFYLLLECLLLDIVLLLEMFLVLKVIQVGENSTVNINNSTLSKFIRFSFSRSAQSCGIRFLLERFMLI
jgi:hypothetical protein